MIEAELKERTKKFGLRAIDVVEALPGGLACDIVARQLVSAATSVGANYRAVCRSKSDADFIYKLTVVEEEADESGFWLEIIRDRGWIPERRITPLINEADELTAIMVSSRITKQRGKNSNKPQQKIKNRKSKFEIRK